MDRFHGHKMTQSHIFHKIEEIQQPLYIFQLFPFLLVPVQAFLLSSSGFFSFPRDSAPIPSQLLIEILPGGDEFPSNQWSVVVSVERLSFCPSYTCFLHNS